MKTHREYKRTMSIPERLAYTGYCLLTFGALWALKLAIQKAISDSQDKEAA